MRKRKLLLLEVKVSKKVVEEILDRKIEDRYWNCFVESVTVDCLRDVHKCIAKKYNICNFDIDNVFGDCQSRMSADCRDD
jgi:hypothetical protein